MNSDEEYLDRLLRSVSDEDKTRGKSSMASEQENSNTSDTTISGDNNSGNSSVIPNSPLEVKTGNNYSSDELAEMLEHLNLDEGQDENQDKNIVEDDFLKSIENSDISDTVLGNPNENNELEDIFAMNDNYEEDFSADKNLDTLENSGNDETSSYTNDVRKTETDLKEDTRSLFDTEAEVEPLFDAEVKAEPLFDIEVEAEPLFDNEAEAEPIENPEELENDEILNLLKTLSSENDNDEDFADADIAITDDTDDFENGEIEVNLSEIADREKALGIKEKKSKINDDEDVTLLLDTLPEDDELAEINNLLKKTDNQEFVEDDMLSLLENMPKENDDAKKNSKAAGKGNDDAFDFFSNDEAEGDTSEEDEEIAKLLRTGNAVVDAANKKNSKAEKSEKAASKKAAKVKPDKKANKETTGEKQGFFKKLFALLTAVDEDDEEAATAAAGGEGELDENNKILQELDKADKAKKGKGKSSKKTKPNDEDEEADEKGKKGKSAKKSKEKAPKKEKTKKAKPAAIEDNGPKLKKKAVVLIAILTITIFIAIMLVSTYIPSIIEKNEAHTAFDNLDYASTFYLLTGEKLDEKDAVIYRKSTLILGLQREYDSYNNYITIGDPLKALNALMGGIETYQFNYNEAVQLGIETAYNEKYNNLLSLLTTYNLTEADALTINALDNKTYSLCLEEIVEGRDYKTVLQPDTTATATDTTTFTDVLPEEQSTATDLLNTINN